MLLLPATCYRESATDATHHVRLTLRPDPSYTGTAPPAIRLRHVLKRLLRNYGFRCTAAEPVPHDEPTETTTP